ncbi:O-succinylbenzoic acid--CoA ligase [Pseudarcicella hirudinis]|uniref:O-succinylbenzoic acid--CoA ligase n=1 Tax=Pseudarcicella hirudinis TaxID=1079859 RepID=A0A1I5UUC5_9BACT|nr:AMP-binding protein [Pseudarcicella hirudinis]SFP98914.1 O-succinylbenzoic acid--CoA ligase [Pseudarcicella hirudinis]
MLFIDSFSDLPAPAKEYEHKVINFCKDWLSGQSTFILKTSGSTGEPKPILLSRNQMQDSAKLTGQKFNLKPGDHILVCLNVEYIAGIMMLVRALELKLKMTVIEPSGNPLEEFNLQDSFDFTAFVPLQLQNILSDSPEKIEILNKMKAIIVGGAAVNERLEEQIQSLSVPVFSTYGMTETVSHIAVRRLNGIDKTSSFEVLNGVKIDIDDRNCLNIVAAAGNFEKIQTNDVVELLDDTTFKLIGRFDNIINSGGVKIQLEKVEKSYENLFKEMKLPCRFFAFGIDDEKLGQKLALFIEMAEKSPEIGEKLRNYIPEFLGIYEMPKVFCFIPEFKETPTGKIDKKQTIKMIQ